MPLLHFSLHIRSTIRLDNLSLTSNAAFFILVVHAGSVFKRLMLKEGLYGQMQYPTINRNVSLFADILFVGYESKNTVK